MSEIWPSIKVGDCCDILDNLRVPLNAEERDDIKGNIPYYGANGLQGYIDKFIFDEPLILLAEDGGYFDEYESRPIAYRISGKSWVNNHAHILRTKVGGSFSQDFVFYCLEHKNITPFIKGGTRAKLNQDELREILIPKPPELIQRRIADILSTVDEAIEQTEALIAKYQQIKAGLMHDLFTRGVTPDGQLRPTRAEAPHLYKESPLGWIPKEWEVSTLRESCEWFSGGTPSRNKTEWWNGDFPWLTPKDMKAFELSDTSEHITKEAALMGSRIVGAGAVFIVVRGMILAHSFPVVLGLKDFAFNQDIKAIQPGNRLSNRFLAYWFVGHTDLFLKKTTEATHGTKRFDLQEIGKLSIGLPGKDEQNAIVAQLDSISTRVEFEHAAVAKLHQQKHGLMHDLLTGRVRVQVERAETPV